MNNCIPNVSSLRIILRPITPRNRCISRTVSITFHKMICKRWTRWSSSSKISRTPKPSSIPSSNSNICQTTRTEWWRRQIARFSASTSYFSPTATQTTWRTGRILPWAITSTTRTWTELQDSIDRRPHSVSASFPFQRTHHFRRLYSRSVSIDDATCTWSGFLQPRIHKVVNYSPKVFLGGIPWDISEQSLIQIFKQFGPIKYVLMFASILVAFSYVFNW